MNQMMAIFLSRDITKNHHSCISAPLLRDQKYIQHEVPKHLQGVELGGSKLARGDVAGSHALLVDKIYQTSLRDDALENVVVCLDKPKNALQVNAHPRHFVNKIMITMCNKVKQCLYENMESAARTVVFLLAIPQTCREVGREHACLAVLCWSMRITLANRRALFQEI